MSSAGAASRAAVSVSSGRAEASRKNGARSRGPRTTEGKARSSQNALKHGLRAQQHVVLPDEDMAEFAALETALIDELAPQGVLQSILVRRIAHAAWRLERAERLEVELFEEQRYGDAGPGLALIRDGNGTKSFDTLLRYRGAALADLWRALRTLKALQAEHAMPPPARATGRAAAPALVLEPRRGRAGTAIEFAPDREAEPRRNPIEPEAGGNRSEPERAPTADRPDQPPAASAGALPNEPSRYPAVSTSRSIDSEVDTGSHAPR